MKFTVLLPKVANLWFLQTMIASVLQMFDLMYVLFPTA